MIKFYRILFSGAMATASKLVVVSFMLMPVLWQMSSIVVEDAVTSMVFGAD